MRLLLACCLALTACTTPEQPAALQFCGDRVDTVTVVIDSVPYREVLACRRAP